MSKIDEKVVDQLAELARLEFNPQEKKKIVGDMERMLAFVAKIEEIDTSGVKPLIYPLEEETPLREDQEKRDYTHQDALRNAPDKDTDFIRVPKVLDKK